MVKYSLSHTFLLKNMKKAVGSSFIHVCVCVYRNISARKTENYWGPRFLMDKEIRSHSTWLLKEEFLVRILSGNYNGKTRNAGAASSFAVRESSEWGNNFWNRLETRNQTLLIVGDLQNICQGKKLGEGWWGRRNLHKLYIHPFILLPEKLASTIHNSWQLCSQKFFLPTHSMKEKCSLNPCVILTERPKHAHNMTRATEEKNRVWSHCL